MQSALLTSDAFIELWTRLGSEAFEMQEVSIAEACVARTIGMLPSDAEVDDGKIPAPRHGAGFQSQNVSWDSCSIRYRFGQSKTWKRRIESGVKR